MKYCRNCGSKAEDGDVFCGYCGSKLEREQEESKQDFSSDGSQPYATEDFYQSEGERDARSDFGASSNEFDNAATAEYEYVDEKRGTTVSFSANQTDKRKPLMRNQNADKANTYGILALIFGILGGILGIIFGALGLSEANKAAKLCESGEFDGKNKISNARILSIIGIVVASIWIVTLFF